jgi:hypothetical protein
MKTRIVFVSTICLFSMSLVELCQPVIAQNAVYHSVYVGYNQQGQVQPSLSWESTFAKAQAVAAQKCSAIGLSECSHVATVTGDDCIGIGFEWGGGTEKGPFKAYYGNSKALLPYIIRLYPSQTSCVDGQVTGGLENTGCVNEFQCGVNNLFKKR